MRRRIKMSNASGPNKASIAPLEEARIRDQSLKLKMEDIHVG